MANFMKYGNTLFKTGNTIFQYPDLPKATTSISFSNDMSSNNYARNILATDDTYLYECTASNVRVRPLSNLLMIATTIPISGALSVAKDSVANELYVGTSSDVRILDGTSFVQKSTISYPGWSIAIDGTSRIFLGYRVLDYSTKALLTTLSGQQQRSSICVDATGGQIFACDNTISPGSIMVYNYSDLSSIGTLTSSYLQSSGWYSGPVILGDRAYFIDGTYVKSFSRTNPFTSGVSAIYNHGAVGTLVYGITADLVYNRIIFCNNNIVTSLVIT